MVLFLAHLVLAHLLWRAIRAWGTQPPVATALAAIFALLGAGGTNILWEFQIGYVASLLLGWSFILLVNHDGGLSRHDVFGAVAATAALMTSGVAVSMVVVGGLVAMGRRGWRAGVVAVVPPGIVYLVWFVLIGHAGFRLAGPWQRTVRAVPAFVVTGLISAFSDAVGSRLFGPVVLIGLALWALRRWNLIRTAACPALMGLVGTVVFLVITSFGRDFDSAALNRYVYVVVALLLPAAGLALSYVIARRKGRLIAVLGLLVLVGIANLGQLVTLRNRYTSQSLTTERQIIAAARIAAVEPVIADSRPAANVDAPDLYISVLKVFTRNGDLPTGVHPGPLSVVNAATEIQLGLTTKPLFGAGGASILLPSPGFVVHVETDRCWSATSVSGRALLDLNVHSPTALWVDARLGGTMYATLTLGGQQGDSRSFGFGRQEQRWFDLAASPTRVSLATPAGLTFASCSGSPE